MAASRPICVIDSTIFLCPQDGSIHVLKSFGEVKGSEPPVFVDRDDWLNGNGHDQPPVKAKVFPSSQERA